jgi:hypothetical protein
MKSCVRCLKHLQARGINVHTISIAEVKVSVLIPDDCAEIVMRACGLFIRLTRQHTINTKEYLDGYFAS